PERRRVDAFALKTSYRRIDLLPGLRIVRPVHERSNKRDVSRFVERGDFDEFSQHFDTIVWRHDGAESLKQLLAQLTKAVPLAREPVFERVGPFDGKTLEKVAAKQIQERPEVARRPAGQRLPGMARDHDCVDVERVGLDADLRAVGNKSN